MTYVRPDPNNADITLPRLPGWVTSVRPQVPEDVAFLSGAALAHLHLVMHHPKLPNHVLRDRLALLAAEACMIHSGRPERAGDLRDEVHLARPGDSFGPGGQVFARWRRWVRAPHARRNTTSLLEATCHDRMDVAKSPACPVAAVAKALRDALDATPLDEAEALMTADARLSDLLGWVHPTPLLSLSLKRGDLRKKDDELRLACHHAILSAAPKLHRVASDLLRRSAHLRAAAPMLRAKAAGAAIAVFLTRDALSPSTALSPVVAGSDIPMSDRAARRLCDRLVGLGVVRELTGRDTFRLYGL